jgi:hypothetical protein
MLQASRVFRGKCIFGAIHSLFFSESILRILPFLGPAFLLLLRQYLIDNAVLLWYPLKETVSHYQ